MGDEPAEKGTQRSPTSTPAPADEQPTLSVAKTSSSTLRKVPDLPLRAKQTEDATVVRGKRAGPEEPTVRKGQRLPRRAKGPTANGTHVNTRVKGRVRARAPKGLIDTLVDDEPDSETAAGTGVANEMTGTGTGVTGLLGEPTGLQGQFSGVAEEMTDVASEMGANETRVGGPSFEEQTATQVSPELPAIEDEEEPEVNRFLAVKTLQHAPVSDELRKLALPPSLKPMPGLVSAPKPSAPTQTPAPATNARSRSRVATDFPDLEKITTRIGTTNVQTVVGRGVAKNKNMGAAQTPGAASEAPASPVSPPQMRSVLPSSVAPMRVPLPGMSAEPQAEAREPTPPPPTSHTFEQTPVPAPVARSRVRLSQAPLVAPGLDVRMDELPSSASSNHRQVTPQHVELEGIVGRRGHSPYLLAAVGLCTIAAGVLLSVLIKGRGSSKKISPQPPAEVLPPAPTEPPEAVAPDPKQSANELSEDKPVTAGNSVAAETDAGPKEQAGSAESPDDSGDQPRLGDRERALARDALGRRAFKKNRLKLALRRYLEAAQADASYAPVHRNLGQLYHRDGKWSKAVEAYTQYLALAPDAKDKRTIRKRIRRLMKRR